MHVGRTKWIYVGKGFKCPIQTSVTLGNLLHYGGKMIKPLGTNLLIKQEKATDKTTQSGLVLSASFADTGPAVGEIIAMGDGEQNYLGDVIKINGINVGDFVFFNEHSAIEIEGKNMEKYLLVNSKNVLAVRGE
jgi:co-chaperonin GroES (HSP10)